jgi:hypothetical protein
LQRSRFRASPDADPSEDFMKRFIGLLWGGIALIGNCVAAPMDGWSNQGVEIGLSAAIEEYDLAKKLMSISSSDSRSPSPAKVRVVEGDLVIDGPLVCDWDKGHAVAGLIVTGALIVSGPIINENRNGGPFLLVEGNTRARAIVGGGAELVFVGDAVVDEIVVGEYNDGILRFLGSLKTPVAVTNDHHFEISDGLEGRWLDTFDEGHLWSSVLHSGIRVPKDDEGAEDFDITYELIPRLVAGAPVLRSDLPPIEDYPELFE